MGEQLTGTSRYGNFPPPNGIQPTSDMANHFQHTGNLQLEHVDDYRGEDHWVQGGAYAPIQEHQYDGHFYYNGPEDFGNGFPSDGYGPWSQTTQPFHSDVLNESNLDGFPTNEDILLPMPSSFARTTLRATVQPTTPTSPKMTPNPTLPALAPASTPEVKTTKPIVLSSSPEPEPEFFHNLPEVVPSIQLPPAEVWAPVSFSGELYIEPGAKDRTGMWWNNQEKEALLAYLQRPGIYAKVKLDPTKVWQDMERDIYKGTRKAHTIAGAWKTLSDSFTAAQGKLKGTGQGERKIHWKNEKDTWLYNECPYYAELGDIFMRLDKTRCPPVAIDTGGRPRISKANISTKSSRSLLQPFVKPEVDDEHPPAGGRKDPTKEEVKGMGKRKRNAAKGFESIPAELAEISRGRFDLLREKFEYEKIRDTERLRHEMEIEDKRLRAVEIKYQMELLRRNGQKLFP
ncbi:hypothetical protein BJ508DRAFT_367170 [Ascobolus immersus RN42]|uniref:Uncharacterized protein n=1 Tax=Ascobolus immersus RN42 TaxID=1160509 RepID=A0A3N4HGC7_ASCIM|nr:hypothetical protein BJ508DRAFT_367170 [Ascobolus immersus RN42]